VIFLGLGFSIGRPRDFSADALGYKQTESLGPMRSVPEDI